VKRTIKFDVFVIKVDQRLLDEIVEDFECSGLGLPPEKRERLKEIKKRFYELSIKGNDFTKKSYTIIKSGGRS